MIARNTKTTLFAPLIAAMIVAAFVPMSGANPHFVLAEDGTKEYGITNENSQVKALIKKATTLQSTYESA